MGETRTAIEELTGLWFSSGDEDGPIVTRTTAQRATGPRASRRRAARGVRG
ncbi:hypothetical protein OG946_03375 [Streptomyces sp. NBC_01808]|uniref:hypothetical protein n=1 Tax=Streptomyces sp. NBC_01808 TaxID=2975947 RepID=UPI002DDC2C8B|nr:hypothetical protein [Streptomyces sp. NBC_01808]WSA36504.1 hypothetical protein OG946_03375 [Streptomyces sp. NBC_01808]